MKALLKICFVLFVTVAYSQKASYTSEPIDVDFGGNNPTFLAVTNPSGLEEKSRGFTKVKTKRMLVEGRVEDKDGISLFLLNNFPVQVFEDGYFSKTIDIKDGENSLHFKLKDGKGFEFERSYTIVGNLAPAETNPFAEVMGDQPGKYYALLIGEDEYYDPAITDLDKPVRDAEQLADILKRDYIFDEENVKILKNASRAEIIDELVNMRKKVTPNDNFLLFYAGHGYYDESSDIGYWIPTDGQKSSTANWFRNSTLTDEIGAIKSKHTLLIADACFSGSIFKSRKAFADASVAINKLYEMPSRKAMTSGALTEVPDRSAFITYLTKRLEGNTEKYVTSEQLFSSLRIAVINNSDVVPQYGTIQKVGDEGGDFIFIRRD